MATSGTGGVLSIEVGDGVLEAHKKMGSLSVDGAAVILKVEGNVLLLEHSMLEGGSVTVDDVAEELSPREPRFILYLFKKRHDELRVSYPFLLIRYIPETANPRMRMTYAQLSLAVSAALPVQYVLECRDLDELTTEWVLANAVSGPK